MAEAAYSTVIGYNNKITFPNSFYYNGTCCFVGGHDNYQRSNGAEGEAPSMIFGRENGAANNPITGSSIVLGNFNKNLNTVQPGNGVTIGNSNKLQSNGMIFGNSCTNETSQGAVKYMIGEGINSYGAWNEKTMGIGLFNKTSQLLSNACLVVGCGTSNTARKNALEINNTQLKITNNLQLASDSTEVNAIVPPADPNNVTADDQTLATKAYVVSQIPVVPSIPTDLVLGTSYAISAGNETLTPNTPVTLATIIGDNSWVFPYSSGTLKIFFKYPLISKIVCEATFLIDGTTTSGNVNSPFSYCMNNGHDVGYIKGGLIRLDYSTMSIELKYGEGIDVNNIDEAIDGAYTDNSTTATLVRIHCTNLY